MGNSIIGDLEGDLLIREDFLVLFAIGGTRNDDIPLSRQASPRLMAFA